MAAGSGGSAPYWVAQHLIQIGLGAWSYINGCALFESGLHVRDLGLDDFCDVVHWFCIRNMSEEERIRWEMQIDMPPMDLDPAEIPSDNAWSVESEMASFHSAIAAFGAAQQQGE